MNELQKEWSVLHPDIEKYERFSLLIKLVSIIICFIGLTYFAAGVLIALFIGILWLQDGIWKTFQKRLEARISYIEQALREKENSDIAFQYYSQWQENRQGVLSLVKEYLTSMAKPTVAYPYVFLLSTIAIVFFV